MKNYQQNYIYGKTKQTIRGFFTALEHIKSGGLSQPSRFPDWKVSDDKVSKYKTTSKALQWLFAAIDDNDVLEAKKILETDSPDSVDPSSDERMCHPLCDCQKCAEISSKKLLSEKQNCSKVSLDQVSSETPDSSHHLYYNVFLGRLLLVQ
jgi:hypothetical protein